MNEELINAIETLELIEEEDFAWYIDKNIAEERIKAIKTISNYIENSIPKEVIEEKMIIDINKLNHSTNGILSEMYKARITLAKELLEGK